MPLGQMLDQDRIDVAVGLDKDGLVGVDVGAKVLAVPQHVLVGGRVAVSNECLALVEGHHHEVNLVALLGEDLSGADLGVDGLVPVGVAAAKGHLIPFLAELVLGRGVLGRVQEELHSYRVGSPDHGLDVELGPAVCRHADKLGRGGRNTD